MEEANLDAIVEFMNSEPQEVNTNEIENTLNYIDSQLAEVPKVKELAVMDADVLEKTETSIEDLTQIALKEFNKVGKNTDEIYDLFYKPLALRQDRSDASKQALIESQRLKVEMINALAGLANAKAKLEQAKQKQVGNAMGIYVNSQSGKEVGISLSNLWDETKK